MGWTPPAIGARGTWTRTFTAADVEAYAAITGDRIAMWRLRRRPEAVAMAGGNR